jgi:DNA-binding CsgD family transcriptional regulator
MNDEQALQRFSRYQSELLEELYKAPTETGRWSAFLKSLVSACSSRSARLLVMDRQAEKVLCSTKFNIDDSEHQAYVDYYVNRCPWRPELQVKPPGRFYNTYYDVSCSQEDFYRTEFYNDWARHLDIAHGLSGSIYTDSRYTVQLLIQRTRGQGPFERDLAALVNQCLAPHVRQALHLARQSSIQKRWHLNALTAAEQSFMPFLLVDERGYTAYQSPKAQALIERWRGLSIKHEYLHFANPAHRVRFRRVLHSVTSGVAANQQTLVLTPEGHKRPVRLVVTPLLPGPPTDDLWPDSPVVAVYLQEPELHMDVDRTLLASLFGLTDAEAGVAAKVSLGLDPKALAEHHEVSVHTVRTQLKSAMRKMGVHRQAEMATRVILSAATRDRNLSNVPFNLERKQ